MSNIPANLKYSKSHEWVLEEDGVFTIGLTDYADDLFALPWWFLFLLFWWDMRQLYLCSWWDSLKRSALVYVYGSLLFVAVCITLAGIIILGELCLRTL